MVNEDDLSTVLSEFARTMVTDFPIQGILDHLVERIVDVLPVTAAGVSLIAEGVAPRYVAASDEYALHCERLQAETSQGPCIAAFRQGEAVTIPDLRADSRFPQFSASAVEAGLAAVFTFPLRHGPGRLGALDLYRDTTGELDRQDLRAAQTLADVAAAYLINAQARDEAQATSDRFHHSALHDPLTGLPNRQLLQERIDHAARRARRSRNNAAVLFADLDRFKAVNDTLGHQVGDLLLIAVAERLASIVRPGDTLARVSGDEFVILCEDLHDAIDVDVLVRRIGESFARPFDLDGTQVSMTASVGVAFAGPGQDISEELVAKADIAMYQAKRQGGAGHRVIDLREALEAGEHDGRTPEIELRSALAQDKLDVAYQPIVRSADGVVIGMEALLRGTYSDRGPVPAEAMVGVAEESGMISEIGTWVLERGCADRDRWLRDHPGSPLDLSVNVSANQLMTPGFCDSVARALGHVDMDPDALILEMTESIFIEDSDRAMTVLAELKELGVRIALDDFGTGFSSLSYLRRLPIHIVKIDRGFIGDIGPSPTGVAIVAAVTNLAHVLGLSVVAEGVETEQQSEEIRAIGCELAQGFFYARPMSASEVDAILASATLAPLRLPAPAAGTVS